MRVSGLRASGLADLPKPPQQGNRGRAARGGLGAWFWGGWAAAPFFLCYGVLHGSASDSRWHECGHGTAFRTPWMNDVVYHIASFMIMREPTVWRWSHARHHTDTLIVGRDPEIVAMRPPRLARILANFFGLVDLPVAFHRLFLHAGGRLTAEEKTFIPDAEQPKVFLIARIWLAIYGATAALCFAMGSILPAMLVGLPRLYGAWHHVLTGLTQHAGLAEDALDHRLNSRTVYMKPISRFVYWNMNYHVEHHMFPMVPYHALPALHEEIKADCPPAYDGLWAAYRELVPAVLRQLRDPTHFVRRTLPAGSTPVRRRPWPRPPPERQVCRQSRPTSRADRSCATACPNAHEDRGTANDQGEEDVTGSWIEACAADDVEFEDVIRFDHDGRTFAIYRSPDDRCYATDGLCTHERAHLADGLVLDSLIECPKHNGRFDYRTGEAKRAPACVDLRTYPVKVEDGKVLIDIGGQRRPPRASLPKPADAAALMPRAGAGRDRAEPVRATSSRSHSRGGSYCRSPRDHGKRCQGGRRAKLRNGRARSWSTSSATAAATQGEKVRTSAFVGVTVVSHVLNYALNHMVAPRKTFAEFVDLAVLLGLEQVEIRNDLPGVAICDGTPPERIREQAEGAGVRILSINALQRFNDWNEERAGEAARLAGYARDCGAPALVLCPVNDVAWRLPDRQRLDVLRQALRALAPILAEADVVGLVEPLGFPESSLRLKGEAVEAIEELELGERFRLVHDTFHHYLAGEARLFPEWTGLVHISGVEDASLPLERTRDEHRVLVGANDLSGALLQILALMEGYSGPYSFEPFAASLHDLDDIAGALELSMHWIDREIARVPA